MKNIWKIALVAALMTSCSQPDIDENVAPEQGAQSGNAIEFYAAGSDSRTTYFEDGLGIHWEEGDEVAIIARGFYDKVVDEELGTTTPTESRQRGKYVAASAGASTSFTYNNSAELAWDLTLTNTDKTITEQDVDFFAVHCGYEYTTSTTVYNGIKVYSSPTQEQSVAGNYSHIGKYTVLASNKVTREAGNTTPIGFEFTNCMSVVELTLKGDAAREIKSVSLTSTEAPLGFSEAFVCVEDFTTSTDVVEVPYTIYPEAGNGTAGVMSNSVSVSLSDYTTLSADGIQLYFVVLPGTHSAGAITLSTTDKNGSTAEVEMGAISFAANKVYRPAVTLSTFEEPTIPPVAELEITGGDDADKMFGTVNFENGATFINSRTKVNGHGADMATYNIPSKFYYTDENTWQTLSLMNSLNPSLDITVKTGGMVYLLVDGNSSTYKTYLTDNGWTCETATYSATATEAQKAGFLADTWDETFPIFYTTALDGLASIAYYAIYSKRFEADDTFNLKELVGDTAATFRGLRVVAKSITWPVAAAEIQQTSELSDGELHTFESGVSIATSYSGAYITATRSGCEKSIPAGFVGMDFFAVKRGSSSAYNCRTVTAKVTKSGMLYQIVPKNAQASIKPSGKNVYDGWRVVDYFHISNITDNPFYISAQWVKAGTEVTTFDYSSVVFDDDTKATLSYFNTGILMGDLTVKETTE